MPKTILSSLPKTVVAMQQQARVCLPGSMNTYK